MDPNKILELLDKGLEAVKTASPLAAALGQPAIGAFIRIAADVGQDLLEKSQTGMVALNSDDEVVLKRLLAEIQEANDERARQVAAS